jgi:hypothetical protein
MGIDFIPVLRVSPTSLDFGKEKGQQNITVDSNIEWTVYSDGDWCKISKSGNEISAYVSKNRKTEKRSCSVVVNGAPYQITQIIKISQVGVGTIVLPSKPTWWKQHRRKIYQTNGVILAGCIIVGICSFFWSGPKRESLRLTEAIEHNDGNVLKEFAGKDSLRAFLPYAQFLVNNGQYVEAIDYAQKTRNSIFYVSAISLIDSINDILKISTIPCDVSSDLTPSQIIPSDFVLIEADSYNYKLWDEKSQTEHSLVVPIDSFFISKYELTQSEYERIMGELKNENVIFGVGEYGGEPYKQIRGDSIPVIATLKEIAEYCNRRSISEGYKGFYNFDGPYITIDKDGNGYRIPTEVEWLFAAHSGNQHEKYKYSGSNKLGDVAWYGGNSGSRPHPVGRKMPNGKGLYDMTGNADEYLWSSTFDGTWYPHSYMNYYMWVGTIDDIVGSKENLGARIVLVPQNNNNLKMNTPVIPNKMKNLK